MCEFRFFNHRLAHESRLISRLIHNVEKHTPKIDVKSRDELRNLVDDSKRKLLAKAKTGYDAIIEKRYGREAEPAYVEDIDEIERMQKGQLELFRTYLNPHLTWYLKYNLLSGQREKEKDFYKTLETVIKNRDKFKYIEKEGEIIIIPRKQSKIDPKIKIIIQNERLAYVQSKHSAIDLRSPSNPDQILYDTWPEAQKGIMARTSKAFNRDRALGITGRDIEYYDAVFIQTPKKINKLLQLRGAFHATLDTVYGNPTMDKFTKEVNKLPEEYTKKDYDESKIVIKTFTQTMTGVPNRIFYTYGRAELFEPIITFSTEGFVTKPDDDSYAIPSEYYNAIKNKQIDKVIEKIDGQLSTIKQDIQKWLKIKEDTHSSTKEKSQAEYLLKELKAKQNELQRTRIKYEPAKK